VLHQRRRPDRPREQVLAWVKGFRQAADALARPPGASASRPSSTHALRYVIEADSYGGDF
jgi:hypothetical protein